MKYTWKVVLTDAAESYRLERCNEEKSVFRLRPVERGNSFYGTVSDLLVMMETRAELKSVFNDEKFASAVYDMEEGPTP